LFLDVDLVHDCVGVLKGNLVGDFLGV
jgi:hypothetical protein